MSSCCTRFCSTTGRQFDHRVAARDIRQYRRKGLTGTAKLLRDSLCEAGAPAGTLLDVGGGIGALSLELIEAGVERALIVDASAAYVAAGREEAARQARGDRIEWRHADFVSVAPEIGPATIVTLDRVVCCYPAHEPLLTEALRHAERWFAVSYPADRWHMRAAIALENGLRMVAGNQFRAFVHPAAVMERLMRGAGLRLVSRRRTIAWIADVWER